jgi:hypothetical protein
MVKPTKQEGAKLAQASYLMGKKGDSKKERTKKVNNYLDEKELDYVFLPQHSNSNISTFHKKDDPSNLTIAYRGTVPDFTSRRSIQDLATDIGFGVGLGRLQPDLKRRKERTNDIIRELKPTNLNLVGHSLGGISANYVVANSKKVRRNLTSSQTYNAGFNPIAGSGVAVSEKNKEKLKDKVTHYRVRGDPISFFGGEKFEDDGVPFGTMEEQKHKGYKQGIMGGVADVAKYALDNSVLGNLIGTGKASLKGLHAHGVNQFTGEL